MKWALWLTLVAMASAPATQIFAASEVMQDDAVRQIRQQYARQFSELPPMRPCMIEDIRGAWREQAVYQSSPQGPLQEREEHGPYYLWFAEEYHRVVWQRMREEPPAHQRRELAERSKAQYIATASGMLYLYDSGTLWQSFVCAVSAEKTQKFQKNMLMLALAPEKDKPLILTIYAPLE